MPALSLQRRVDAIGEGDELFEIGLEVQQHELGVELQAEGVAEGGLEGKGAQCVGRTVQAPELDRAAEVTAARGPVVVVEGISGWRVTYRLRFHAGELSKPRDRFLAMVPTGGYGEAGSDT